MHKYKTQVLLLHSQQSTLERFSESLGDDYSVHTATTGTEALDTLGLTPIHVMVTAQELPGMSGVEALREARRHSPDTIGILIAPEDISGIELEALVGREQLFQVIRGVATPDEMRQVIDGAVEKLKVTTLRDSANDRSAGPQARIAPTAPPAPPRRPSPGLPALPRSTGLLPAPTAGDEAATRVVVLSKDEVFAETIRQALGPDQPVYGARRVAEAAEHIVEDGRAVLVTDAAVAPRAVETLTKRLRRRQPGLVTIVAGRRDDGDQLMGLVNEGMIYRFLLKPVSPGRARLAIDAAVRRARETASGEARSRSADETPDPSSKGTGKPASKPAQAQAPAAAEPPPDRITPRLEDFADAEEVVLSEEPAEVIRPAIPVKPASPPPAPQKAARGGPNRHLRTAGASSSWWRHLRLIGLLLGITGAAAVWYQSRLPAVTEPPVPVEAAAEPAASVDPDLLQARAARSEGRLLTPGEDGALPLYAAALRRDPSDPSVREEVRDALADAYAALETALDEGSVDTARSGRAVIAAAFPASPRLAVIDARLTATARDRLLQLADEQAAQGDTGRALATLDEAESLAAGRDPAVAAKRDALLAAAEDRDDTLLLELANQRLLQEALVEPAGDNARYFYEAVLARNAESAEGRQGMTFLQTALISRIRDAIGADDRRAAQRWLEEARLTGIDEGRLQKLRQAADRLPGIGAATTADLLPPLTPVEPEVEPPPVPRRDAGANTPPPAYTGTRTAASAPVPELPQSAAPVSATAPPVTAEGAGRTMDRLPVDPVPTLADTPGPADEAPGAAAFLSESDARAGALEPGAVTVVMREPTRQKTATADDRGPAAGSSSSSITGPAQGPMREVTPPDRIAYREPAYPRNAETRGIEGWVDVEFRLSPSGEPRDTRIAAAEPLDVFEDAALDAVAEWRYRPPSETGWPGDRPLRIRIHFGLEER